VEKSRLLDAAHSVMDADEQLGEPIVSNGLPLTKIHHGAFDANLTGIDPHSDDIRLWMFVVISRCHLRSLSKISCQETPSTALTTPPAVKKWVCRSAISSSGRGGATTSPLRDFSIGSASFNGDTCGFGDILAAQRLIRARHAQS
jgi:hypothetical protein